MTTRRAYPAFVHVDVAETFTLPSGSALPLAAIRLGQHDGRWFCSTEANAPGFGGHSGPLGFTEGREGAGHASRAEALAAAVAEIERRCGDAPDRFRKQIEWARGLLAERQVDLFGAAA